MKISRRKLRSDHAAAGSNNAAAESGGPGSDGTASDGTASGDAIAQLTTKFVGIVDAVASRTTRPLLVVVRAVVYAMVIVLLVAATATLLVIATIRGVDTAVEVLFDGEIWLTYFICSVLFGLLGWILWAKRRPRTRTSADHE